MPDEERLTPEEIARRRDDAIRRALSTPPKPKKPRKPKATKQQSGGEKS